MSDVLIIGCGVIGLSIARELRRRGAGKITIVEKGVCGREASWAAAGMLSPDVETVETDEFYSLSARSRDMYPTFAKELLDETGIDVELDQTGSLGVAFDDENGQRLLEKCSKQKAAGIEVESLSTEEILKREPELSSLITIGAFYPNDWQVENRKLLAALRRYAEFNDIEIRENTAANEVIIQNGKAHGIRTADDTTHASHTIIATGAWTSLIKLGTSAMPFAVKPIRGQIVEFQGPPQAIRHVVWSKTGYIVPRIDGRVLAGSTSEDVGFDHSVTDEARKELISMASQILPALGSMPIADQWSGLRPMAGDGLPVLGGIPGIEQLTVATAHYRNGILLAPATAKLVADNVVNGRDVTEFAVFGPDRFRSAAASL